MKRALAASLVLHGVLATCLLSFALREGDGNGPRDSKTIAIEVIAPPSKAPSDVEGGGSPRATATVPGSSNVEATSRSTSHTTPVASRIASRERGRAHDRALDLARAQLAEYALDHGSGLADGTEVGGANGGVDRRGDGGEGNGIGGNRGDGIGFGDGGRIVLDEQPATLPEPPKADVPPPSKARPAKLIYPKRTRDLGADKLFVAKITVDTDGYVVGAHLVHGIGGPRDAEAADLIFRFRYLPALDDAGRAIRSTFEQPFHVNR